MTRDRHEREQDRADLLAALAEHRDDPDTDGPMRLRDLIVAATGRQVVPVELERRVISDLRALVRDGLVCSELHRASWTYRWRLGTSTDAAVDEDRADVARAMDAWEPAS